MNEAWFSALGAPLGDDERREIADYLGGLGMDASMPVHLMKTWSEAGETCQAASDRWWDAEEEERARLERKVRLDPADLEWLALNEALHGAASGHPFLRKYALYCGGRWPLGVYQGRFAIF